MTYGRWAFFYVVLFSLVFSLSVRAGDCALDSDCDKGHVCFSRNCKKLDKVESLLNVELATTIEGNAGLFIDDVYMGPLPWTGIISAEYHEIRVEAPGMITVQFKGESPAAASDTIKVTMEPEPVVATGPGEPDAKAGRDEPGTIFFALFGGGGYGVGGWGSDGWKRPIASLAGGGALGLRLPTDPIWLDLGLAISTTSLKPFDTTVDNGSREAEWGDFVKINFGLLARLLFPLKKNFLYIGASLEPGYGLSGVNWVYADLHLAMSLFLGKHFEIQANPLGLEYLQDLQGQGYIFSFNARLGVAVRFPKKPLF